MYRPEIIEAGKTINNMPNWTTLSYFEDQKTSTQGIIAIQPYDLSGLNPADKMPPIMAICFKGSEELTDWKIDLMAWKSRWHLWGGETSCQRIHRGFYKAYRGIRLKMLRELRDFCVAFQAQHGFMPRIAIAGHSLGGAVAHLAAYDFVNVPGIVGKHDMVDLVTFGSPMVFASGRHESISAIHAFGSAINTKRFVNLGDPVPNVPRLGYRHYGETITPDCENLHPRGEASLRWSMDNHNINTYINLLSL